VKGCVGLLAFSGLDGGFRPARHRHRQNRRRRGRRRGR
jgi:hypothetical protein